MGSDDKLQVTPAKKQLPRDCVTGFSPVTPSASAYRQTASAQGRSLERAFTAGATESEKVTIGLYCPQSPTKQHPVATQVDPHSSFLTPSPVPPRKRSLAQIEANDEDLACTPFSPRSNNHSRVAASQFTVPQLAKPTGLASRNLLKQLDGTRSSPLPSDISSLLCDETECESQWSSNSLAPSLSLPAALPDDDDNTFEDTPRRANCKKAMDRVPSLNQWMSRYTEKSDAEAKPPPIVKPVQKVLVIGGPLPKGMDVLKEPIEELDRSSESSDEEETEDEESLCPRKAFKVDNAYMAKLTESYSRASKPPAAANDRPSMAHQILRELESLFPSDYNDHIDEKDLLKTDGFSFC